MDSIHVHATGLAIGDSAAVELGDVLVELMYEPETPDSGTPLLEMAIDVDLGPLMRQLVVTIPPHEAGDLAWFTTAAAIDIEADGFNEDEHHG